LNRQDGNFDDFMVEELTPESEQTIESFVIKGTPVLHLISDRQLTQDLPPFFSISQQTRL